MNLFYAIILLILGLTILIKGADWLVDGAVAIARHFGMSPLIIGLTIVAMGTSAPEVAASIVAALTDSGGIAVGNVYGSNIANLAMVGGICAIVRPIVVSRDAIVRDIPIMIGVSLLLYGIFMDSAHSIGHIEAGLLLLLFAGIILFLIYSEKKQTQKGLQQQTDQEAAVEHAIHHPPKTLWGSSLFILLGLVCLAGGAQLTVVSAKYLGQRAGLSDEVIGQTIVAVGTSLPELITCLIAALKGHDDLSVGNLVGSNIFNTLLVTGAAGLTKPFVVSARMAGADLWLMVGVSVLFSVIAFAYKKINRPAGVFLTVIYVGYIAYLLKTGTPEIS